MALSCWCGAAFLLSVATYDSINRWRILHGPETQARVASIYQQRHQGRVSYYIGADFVDSGNVPYWVELLVNESHFANLRKGDWVAIRYRADHPADALLASDSWLRLRNAGALLVAMGLYAAGRVRWQRWRQHEQKLA
ncbi:DUF3592 domain-containing protein [Hymenobacter sp. 15J16-1T3B]|uniref:DUF3592 domain-containing protein n=1 Tax=Hymenobacter sp. 15J16-1T3B TaxID=2886941 RepID=UPI001D105869|nr:DUF3592 domain-containing protein [Hymenobacter sp. 15J16-1T3B]MCC3157964.1 DUF3592 domain-containing protein [Hymenobacter sp. 15J16-1T3B]